MVLVVMAAVAHSASSVVLAQQWGPACYDCHRHPLLALTGLRDLLLHMKLLQKICWHVVRWVVYCNNLDTELIVSSVVHVCRSTVFAECSTHGSMGTSRQSIIIDAELNVHS